MEPAEVRAAALACATRATAEGQPPGYFLSTARQFERYIASGVSQTGAGGRNGVQVHLGDLLVRIDGNTLDDDLAQRLEAAVRSAVAS